MKKLLFFFLATVMLACTFAGCTPNDTTSDAESSLPADNSAETSDETSTETSEEEKMTIDEYYQTITKLDEYNTIKAKKFGIDRYNFTYYYSDGARLVLSLIHKSWGTWNIGDWKYIDAGGKTHAFDGGSTDFENVYIFGKTAGSATFRGGNHGNDHLVDIKFFDATTGEEVNLADGQEHEMKGVRIIEHTQIYDSGTENVMNSEDDVLVNMERIYTLNGPDIYLECNVDFVKDTYAKIGYTTMFPIAKKYGDMIKFTNMDGTEKVAQTPVVGTSQYGNNFSDYNKSMKVNIWGSQNPQFQFEVEIYDESMLNPSTYYTRYWDMNTSHNKLYFSIYNNDSATKIPAETHWDALARWSFDIDEDFTFEGTVDQKVGF